MDGVGARVEAMRTERKLSQTELVSAVLDRFPYARISQQNLSQLERGDIERSGYLVELALVLGVSPIWLATGEGPRILEYLGADRSIADTIRLMETMPEYRREQTARVVRELARDQPDNSKP